MIRPTDAMADRAIEVLLEAGVLREPVDPFAVRATMRDALEAALPAEETYRWSGEPYFSFSVIDVKTATTLIRDHQDHLKRVIERGR